MDRLIDITAYPIINVLDFLLKDKTTGKNIIWATDTYSDIGDEFGDKSEITKTVLLQNPELVKPRIEKSLEEQADRTRKKAEVFTPAWICNTMNNYTDEEWFGRKDVFNIENADHTWSVVEDAVIFPSGKKWTNYVDSRRLEITCGEAPYLVSRYDTSTGTLIVPTKRRIGQLDRKIRVINENAADYDEWLKWVIRAYEACYGYEYQGDNLLIARINLLLTFLDYYTERWEKQPENVLLREIAERVVWNVWQMDGLKDTVPLGKPGEEVHQMSLEEAIFGFADDRPGEIEAMPCKIKNWRSKDTILFKKLKEL